MTPPAANEINVFNSLDEIAAAEHFQGKTVEEAELLFREDSGFYQEDLMWMGPVAFNYYLESAIRYLESAYAKDDDHFISCLYEIVQFRRNEDMFSLAAGTVGRMLDYVINNYTKFNVSEDIYGDLLTAYKELRDQLKK